MERVVVVEPLGERFTIGLRDANRERRTRSFANVSDCCGKIEGGKAVGKLRIEKHCSACGGRVDVTPSRKAVKVGKNEYILPSSAIEAVKERVEAMEEIRIQGIIGDGVTPVSVPLGVQDFFDGLVYAVPVEKKEREYAELCGVLRGRVAFGRAVFRGDEFQVLVMVGDDGVLRIRKLVDGSQRHAFDAGGVSGVVSGVGVSGEVVGLMREVLGRSERSFDPLEFRDSRLVLEEELLERVATLGELPVDAPVVGVVLPVESERLERLRAMLK